VYEYLRRSLGADVVTADHWVSGSRGVFVPGGDGGGDDRLGYDMVVHDATGRLGRPGPTTYYIEVKGQLSPTKKTIYLTDNEWRTCRAVHEGDAPARASRAPAPAWAGQPGAASVYVVVVVCLAPDPVRVLYWLEDPYALMTQGLIAIKPDRLAMLVNVPPLHVRARDPASGADAIIPAPPLLPGRM
jgi:hypothetical protein